MEAVGQLRVRVYTSRAQLPVMGATVVVTSRGESGRTKLVSIQTTDSSGSIQPVELPAPIPMESTQPQNTSHPFSVCDVWAEHPGFAMLVVEGVQIFPGVETYQAMELSPLSEGESSLVEISVRDPPPQNL